MADKFFFTEDNGERFTTEALEFDMRLSLELRKYFKEKVDEGFGVRDIAQVMHGCVASLMYEFLLGCRAKAAKEKRNVETL
jgi:hypothetical protein